MVDLLLLSVLNDKIHIIYLTYSCVFSYVYHLPHHLGSLLNFCSITHFQVIICYIRVWQIALLKYLFYFYSFSIWFNELGKFSSLYFNCFIRNAIFSSRLELKTWLAQVSSTFYTHLFTTLVQPLITENYNCTRNQDLSGSSFMFTEETL